MESNIICAALLITITLANVASDTIQISEEFEDPEYFYKTYTDEEHAGDVVGDVLSLKGTLRRHFAYSLFLQRIRDSTICSPLSALMPLGKLALGASNDTLQELFGTIGVNKLSDVNVHFKYMITHLKRMASVAINIYSAIYVNNNYELQSEFKENAIKVFGASVGSLNFDDPAIAAKKINDWVSKKTNNTINDLISESALSADTKIVLVNAVYFSGQWKYPFMQTQKEIFYAQDGPQNVTMMLNEAEFFYYKSKALSAQVIELPYVCHDRMSMIILLPTSNSSDALEVLLRALKTAPELLDSVLKNMRIHRVNLSLPRFKIGTNFDLGEQYEKIGLKRIFHTGLDKIVKDNDIFVSKAIQSAIIQVDENGTMATAASSLAIMMSDNKEVPPIVNFTANHPFFFILLARSEQLFSGVLNDVPKE